MPSTMSMAANSLHWISCGAVNTGASGTLSMVMVMVTVRECAKVPAAFSSLMRAAKVYSLGWSSSASNVVSVSTTKLSAPFRSGVMVNRFAAGPMISTLSTTSLSSSAKYRGPTTELMGEFSSTDRVAEFTTAPPGPSSMKGAFCRSVTCTR